VGNAAAEQFQLDVYGEVMDALALARDVTQRAHADAWGNQRVLLDFLEGAWSKPDEGLWEVRGERQHFVHSKVLAWVGFDRAVRAVERFGLKGDVDRWRALRDQVHDEVCRKGFDAERGTFTQAFGSRELDAATLLIAPVGFLPADDPRYLGTVDAVARELRVDGLVRRYDVAADVDGLGGTGEGAFLACSFWLADGLSLVGRRDEAHELFDRLLDLRNDVGLLAEEYDPVARRQLGNVPQAYSHVALINTALHLHGENRPVTRRAHG
jgi:GH15 family glucan-1,4-alpha-glucosidase